MAWAVVMLGAACGSWQRVGTDTTSRPGPVVPRLFDASSVYRSMGALVGGGALPFIASVRYLAGPTPDSTLALFSVSLTNQTLSFQRHGGEFTAEYRVEASFRTDSTSPPVRQLASDEQVRVRDFQETLRADESIIFQQFVTVPPGVYVVGVMVRDRNSPAVARAARVDTAPQFAASPGSMTKPLPVYEAKGRPQRTDHPELVINPRATLPYGTDSLRFYVERYGAPDQAILARVVDGTDRELWRDSVRLTAGADLSFATVIVPPTNLPVGQAELQVVVPPGDTTIARFLISFSNQWVITNFDEMLSVLRYFDRQDWVDSMRRAAPDRRPAIWADFWKQTDPVPITPENEALDEYLRRVQLANARFPDEGQPGWLTERGEVFIALGDPDEALDMSSGLDRTAQRVIRWSYTSQQLVLYFQDQSGFGQFRLTPSSRSEFQRVVARLRRAGR
jgi:GWxTD domain-containing protein